MIRAHREGRALTIDIRGQATMMESPAVHTLVRKHMSHGLRALRVDLRDCAMIDSTFAGTLLSLEHQLDTLTLVSPSPRVLELLRRMGLDDLYTIEAAPHPRGPWIDLSVASPEAEKLTSLVLESHEELAHVAGPHASAFRSVVEELRRDHASRHGGSKG